ncbi:hypothetical protein [Synechococcus sp. WH 8016]|nr:hypothetical protein [Synechococcus sp. WH 8016]
MQFFVRFSTAQGWQQLDAAEFGGRCAGFAWLLPRCTLLGLR